MRPRVFIVSLIFSILFSSMGLAMEADWGGHLRAQGTASRLSGSNILDETGDSGPFHDGSFDGRLKGEMDFGENLTIKIHAEAGVSGGELWKARSRLARIIPGMPGPASPSDDRRFFRLTLTDSHDDSRASWVRLDRLVGTWNLDQGTLRVGRQALTWGGGMIFNPMDLLNPFAPSDVIRDYKVGDDMVVFEGQMAWLDEIQVAGVPRRNEDGDVVWSHSSVAVKAGKTMGETDATLLFARHYEDVVAGGGLTRYIFDAAWRADILWTEPKSHAGYLSAVTNIDYSWVAFGHNMYGVLELYFSGIGENDAKKAFSDPQIMERRGRGELFALGKTYLCGQLKFEAHPLVNLHLSTIFNLSDASTLIQPRVTWDALTSVTFLAGLDIPTGAADTEYGGLRIPPSNKPARSPTRAYILATWYF